MAGVWSTHMVELRADHVVKRYRHCGDREHEREWRALTLLRAYAPGLWLDATMSRWSHVASWVDTGFDADRFLGHFPLVKAEVTRLNECRRLHALLWLVLLSLVGPDDDRNPPDTPLRQARRLRALLSSS
jgi:hypothetical protein